MVTKLLPSLLLSALSDALAANFNPSITWICALFLLCYVGIEVSLGGWLVSFMLKVRHGENFASGMVATGFWVGFPKVKIFP